MAQSARAGLSYTEFWKMTPREWGNWMEGYSLRVDDGWRQTRAIYTLLYNINVESHNQKSAEELMPLASDEKPVVMEVVSLDDKLRIAAAHRDLIKNGKHDTDTLKTLYKIAHNG